MALPKIIQKLFSDEGKGSKLRPDIVPTTINGNSPDSEGNFTPKQTGCLPLSGGTMTGVVKSSVGDFIAKTTNDSYLCLNGGVNSSSGARIVLSGQDREGLEGRFTLVARDANDEKSLTGIPSGSLTWGGKEVITSAGGTISGNITFNSNATYITRSGTNQKTVIRGGTEWNDGCQIVLNGKDSDEGTMVLLATNGSNFSELAVHGNGSLTHNGNTVITSAGGTITGNMYLGSNVSRTTDSGIFDISGGTAWNKGSYLSLSGKDSSRGGQFVLTAHNGTKESIFTGFPDGTLTWRGHKAVHYLDASNHVALGTGSWASQWDGMVYVRGYTGTWGSQVVTLNGLQVGGWRGKECGGCTLFPVKVGDVVNITESSCSEQVRYFIPFI